MTGAIEITKQIVLKKGFMDVAKDSGLASMLLTFETHYPRETITLDGDTIPIVAYRSGKKKVLEADNKYTVEDGNDDKTYSLPTGVVISWDIEFVKNNTTAWAKLEADHKAVTLKTPYVLNIDGVDYNVISGESSESFTDTGDIAIEVSFVEVRV